MYLLTTNQTFITSHREQQLVPYAFAHKSSGWVGAKDDEDWTETILGRESPLEDANGDTFPLCHCSPWPNRNFLEPLLRLIQNDMWHRLGNTIPVEMHQRGWLVSEGRPDVVDHHALEWSIGFEVRPRPLCMRSFNLLCCAGDEDTEPALALSLEVLPADRQEHSYLCDGPSVVRPGRASLGLNFAAQLLLAAEALPWDKAIDALITP